MPSVLLPWVEDLTFMKQSVLIAAVRAPDGMRKDHPVKVLLRWYRRCILLSAFEKRAFADPFEKGGGSFTGPFTAEHASEYRITNDITFSTVVKWWDNDASGQEKWEMFDGMRKVYLRYVDELPHHFQLHFMHAAEIIGYDCPDPEIGSWWQHFYLMIVNDMHLHPETKPEMDKRLGDNKADWRAREEVTAI